MEPKLGNGKTVPVGSGWLMLVTMLSLRPSLPTYPTCSTPALPKPFSTCKLKLAKCGVRKFWLTVNKLNPGVPVHNGLVQGTTPGKICWPFCQVYEVCPRRFVL